LVSKTREEEEDGSNYKRCSGRTRKKQILRGKKKKNVEGISAGDIRAKSKRKKFASRSLRRATVLVGRESESVTATLVALKLRSRAQKIVR